MPGLNINAAQGLKPLRHRDGAPYAGAATRYFVPSTDSTALFIGDPVVLAGSADGAGPNGGGGVATVQRATAGSGGLICGVVVGVENLTSDNLSRRHRPASTAAYVLVATNPDLVFEIQSNGATTNDLVAADVGLNADLATGTGSTVYGNSGFTLAATTKATTSTLQLRILGLVQRADNEIDTTTGFVKAEVMINTHQFRQQTGV